MTNIFPIVVQQHATCSLTRYPILSAITPVYHYLPVRVGFRRFTIISTYGREQGKRLVACSPESALLTTPELYTLFIDSITLVAPAAASPLFFPFFMPSRWV